jgi:hypothetical protein
MALVLTRTRPGVSPSSEVEGLFETRNLENISVSDGTLSRGVSRLKGKVPLNVLETRIYGKLAKTLVREYQHKNNLNFGRAASGGFTD